MKRVKVYNNLEKRDEILILDHQVYLWIKNHQKKVLFNQHGYAMIEYKGKIRPLHVVIYYLYHQVFSEQYKTGVHHINEDKHDLRINNLQLLDWNKHKEIHLVERQSWTEPNPKGLRIA